MHCPLWVSAIWGRGRPPQPLPPQSLLAPPKFSIKQEERTIETVAYCPLPEIFSSRKPALIAVISLSSDVIPCDAIRKTCLVMTLVQTPEVGSQRFLPSTDNYQDIIVKLQRNAKGQSVFLMHRCLTRSSHDVIRNTSMVLTETLGLLLICLGDRLLLQHESRCRIYDCCSFKIF